MKRKGVSRYASVMLLVTSALVLLSPMALAVDYDFVDCYIDGNWWDPDDQNPCPEFGGHPFVEGYFDSAYGDTIDMIYWRLTLTSNPPTEWYESDNFYSSHSYQYYFDFIIEIGMGGYDGIEVWADGTVDTIGSCSY